VASRPCASDPPPLSEEFSLRTGSTLNLPGRARYVAGPEAALAAVFGNMLVQCESRRLGSCTNFFDISDKLLRQTPPPYSSVWTPTGDCHTKHRP